VQLAFVRAADSAADRRLSRANATVVNWTTAPPVEASAFDAWIELATQFWLAARTADLDRLSARLGARATSEQLARVAGRCRSLGRGQRDSR
jgi:hypothetical protein